MSLPTVSPGVALAADLKKTKIVHLIRHGAALHNIYARDYGYQMYLDERLFDAPLHPTGIKQAEILSRSVFPSPHVVLVSPLSRTLQTADAYLGGICSGKVKREDTPRVIALEMVREAYGRNPCDRRRSVAELKEEWPGVDFDAAMVADKDVLWTPERETVDSVARRANELLRFICSLDEQVVAVISHGVFLETFTSTALSALTGLHASHDSLCDHRFTNCEVRSLALYVPDTVPCVNLQRPPKPRQADESKETKPLPKHSPPTASPAQPQAARDMPTAEEAAHATPPKATAVEERSSAGSQDKGHGSGGTVDKPSSGKDPVASEITLEDLAKDEWNPSPDAAGPAQPSASEDKADAQQHQPQQEEG